MLIVVSSYMEDVAAMKLPVPPYDVERLDRAARSFTQLGYAGAMDSLRQTTLADYRPIIVSWRVRHR
jgi:hypothetical protein